MFNNKIEKDTVVKLVKGIDVMPLVKIGVCLIAGRYGVSEPWYLTKMLDKPVKVDSYESAINKIMSSSNLWSSDKRKLVGILQKGQDAEYYQAIAHIVASNMWSSDIVNTINSMNK